MPRTRTSRTSRRTLNGILNVDKPAGWTSFDVVKFIRGRCGEKRVGHAGTLDPAATGVLPVLLGQTTRLTQYLVDTTKAYAAAIQLGVSTDTYDADGEVLSTADAAYVTREQVDAALTAFRGDIMQTPPAYSAIKRAGVPLYRRARRGEAVELEPRPVSVHALEVSSCAPPFLTLDVECGKGFYVRSLAHDVGAALGVGGVLMALRRTRVGAFSVENAVDLEVLRAEFEADTWHSRLYTPDEVLLRWQAAILGDENERRLRNGQPAILDADVAPVARSDGLCRAYSHAGDFIGIARLTQARRLEPEKVFST